MTTFYWNRTPGKFVNKHTGAGFKPINGIFPQFTGDVHEWYETFMETIVDIVNHTCVGPKDDVIVKFGRTAQAIIECSVLWKPIINVDPGVPWDNRGKLINHQFVTTVDTSVQPNEAEIYRGETLLGKVIVQDFQ